MFRVSGRGSISKGFATPRAQPGPQGSLGPSCRLTSPGSFSLNCPVLGQRADQLVDSEAEGLGSLHRIATQ